MIDKHGDWQTVTVAKDGTTSSETDLGGEFIVGDTLSIQADLFGIGFVKYTDLPNPLADAVSFRGVRHSYTWFGGPWMAG